MIISQDNDYIRKINFILGILRGDFTQSVVQSFLLKQISSCVYIFSIFYVFRVEFFITKFNI